MSSETTSPFRAKLESVATRLELLSQRSSPSVARTILLEVVAVREASTRLEGEPCTACAGPACAAQCAWCGGRGDL